MESSFNCAQTCMRNEIEMKENANKCDECGTHRSTNNNNNNKAFLVLKSRINTQFKESKKKLVDSTYCTSRNMFCKVSLNN